MFCNCWTLLPISTTFGYFCEWHGSNNLSSRFKHGSIRYINFTGTSNGCITWHLKVCKRVCIYIGILPYFWSIVSGLHDAVRICARTILQHLLLSVVQGSMEKEMFELTIYFMEGSEISTECGCWYSCHSAVIWYCSMNLIKSNGKFCFLNTVPCGDDTNMAVAGMMTCKVYLIWRHLTPPPIIL